MTAQLNSPARTRRSWPAVATVAVGIFAIVTTEILPIGLLTPIASGFGVSAGVAGWTMTVPGIVAAAAAPAVTVAARRVDRRVMLAALILLLAVANLLTALAPTFGILMVARFLVGLVIGGFWSIGSGLAPRLAPSAVARATSVIFSAVPLGSVLGVPLGTMAGQFAGWRTAFVLMAVVSLALFGALLVSVPSLPARETTSLRVLGGLFRRRGVRSGVVVTVLVVLAHFGTYTYVTPLLHEVVRVRPELLSGFLLAYGVAGLAGNFLAGAMAARRLRITFASAVALLAVVVLVLPFTGPFGAAPLLVLWGLAYGAVPVCSQTWFARSAPHAREAATVVFTSSFQATISLGALAGGFVVDTVSLTGVMLCGGVVAVIAAAVIALS